MKSYRFISYVSDFFIYFIVLIFSVFCIAPFIIVLSASFTSEAGLLRHGYTLFPVEVSLEAYAMIFKNGLTIARSYIVSIIITVTGTIMAVIITTGAAFCLANKQVKYRNTLAFYFFFTMLFSGGLVPWYLICTQLGLRDNIYALIVPTLMFNAFNMFLVRNYMLGIPVSLMESAKIDGANDFVIAFKIYFPLSVPVIAAITMFYALGYWNDWWNAIMLVDDSKLYPLQYFLFKLQSEVQMLRDLRGLTGGSIKAPPTESLRMATAIVTTGPIVLLYPFLQRYFIKGLVIGSVKG